LEVFSRIWIDCLNGDSRETGKITPDGKPDPSVFSTEHSPEGIRVGTAVAVLVCGSGKPSENIFFREFWGKGKRSELLQSLDAPGRFPYTAFVPCLELGLPFRPRKAMPGYLLWPLLPDLFPVSFPGVKTSRDSFLVDGDLEKLKGRVARYLDPDISHAEIRRQAPQVMESTGRFRAEEARAYLCGRDAAPGQFVRYLYRPFDVRWLYWEPETKLLDEKRADYFHQATPRNAWLSAGQWNRKADFYQPQLTTVLADHHIVESNAAMFPLLVYPELQGNLMEANDREPKPNLTQAACAYLARVACSSSDLLYHTLAVLHAPRYSEENAGALRQDWPRAPLPATREVLVASGCLGAELAALLNTEIPIKGVTAGGIRPELKAVGNITAVQAETINPATDLQIDVGWGHPGKKGATMPGKGKLIERDYTAGEREAIREGAARLNLTFEEALAQFGDKTCDVYLNDRACWKNIPLGVWEYTIGGYQVLKKWLSYREAKLLGRPITPEEAHYVRDMARRIAAICLLQPRLDANYAAVKANTYAWPGG